MKQKLLLALLALFTLGGSNLFAQTDVTSTYLTNADFEGEYSVYSNPSSDRAIYQPSGWTIEYNNGEANDMTSLNSNCTQWNQFSGKAQPTDGGNNTYWIRFRWGSNESLQLSQKATLPKGAYILSAEAFFNGSSAVAEISAAGQSTTITKKDAWNNYNVIFNIEEDGTEVTIACTFSQKSQVESIVGFDNFKLIWFSDKDELLRYQNSLTDASATNGIATNFVVNGTFDSNTNGWTCTGGFLNKGTATNQQGDFTGKFWENWNGSAQANKMYQVIDNIPNGTYKLKIAAFVNTLADPNESQFVFANNDKTYLTTGAPTFYEVWTVVTDNKVEIGLEQTTATANWMGIDNVSLTYYGAGDVIAAAQAGVHKSAWDEAVVAAQAAVADEAYANVIGAELTALNTEINKAEPTTADGYDEATAALTAATEAFIAAKPNYDALVAEIAKAKALGMDETTVNGYAATEETTAETALTNTQNLKVAEYNYVTETYQYGVELGEWTSTATGTKAATFNNEHWSGTTHDYKNQDDSNGQGWNANSWSINFSQNVTLPAGNYVFKVAGRQATGDKVNTSLVVKVGETELGSVSDFPRGNAARGINKDGKTSFNESDDAYANSGKGYGWEWRYVKFTLEEDATVNIAINSVATASHMWVSFGDYTVQTDNEANISLIAYNIALNNAKTTLANSDYANVTGEEKTTLKAAIDADETLDKTSKEDIEAATTTLTGATTAFTAAKAAYDAFVAAKTAETPELEYAATSKKDAVTNAKEASDATSASDAETKTAAITQALRVYYESHALAEGVENAQQIEIVDACMESGYDSENKKFGAWLVIGQTNGTIQLLDNQSFTDGNGKNDYKYADIYKNDNNAGIQQTINLEPGKYMLTVTARANTTAGAGFRLFAGDKAEEISRIGNSGGTFDRGWNDTSLEFVVAEEGDVNIGVQSYNGKDLWWSATRFRLVKLPTDEVTLLDAATEAPAASSLANVTYARNLTAGYNSLVLPFEVTKEELGDVKRILEFEGSEAVGEDFKLNFKEVEKVEANKPYLVEMNAATTDGLNFTSKVVAPAEDLSMGDENFKFVGSYVALEKGNDVIKAGDYGCATTGLKKAKDGVAMKAFRAYMKNYTNNPEAGVRVFVDGEEATGIQAVEILESLTDGIYNLQGQKVNKAQKGVYIVNGKKVILK